MLPEVLHRVCGGHPEAHKRFVLSYRFVPFDGLPDFSMAVPSSVRTLAYVLFGVALFGVLVVAHLQLQASTGFAAGCSGFADAPASSTSGCGGVLSSEYATFLGLSNIVWGFLFYGLVAALRLGYAVTGNDTFRKAGFGVVGAGFVYTLYLVYLQVAEIGTLCPLCMLSAATALTLLVLHVMEHRRLIDSTPSRASRGLRPYAAIAGVFLVLLVADLVLAQSREEMPPDEPSATAATMGQANSQGTADVGPAPTCGYNPAIAPIEDTTPFTTGPSKGTEGAPVQVLDLFDPNCPHCRTLSEEVMEQVIAMNSERAEFFYVAYPLRESSVGQVIALDMAAEQSDETYFALMNEMFARQNGQWGMTVNQIEEAADAAGMSGRAIRQRLQSPMASQALINEVMERRSVIGEVFADPDGSISVPRVVINGRQVMQTREALFNVDCLSRLIAEAAGEEPAPTDTTDA